MTPQPGKQTIAVHILPSISRSKGNQTMTWDTFFLKNQRESVVEKLFQDPFLKYQNRPYLWIKSFIQFVFIVCQVEGYQNILKLTCRQLAFTWYKAFL